MQSEELEMSMFWWSASSMSSAIGHRQESVRGDYCENRMDKRYVMNQGR